MTRWGEGYWVQQQMMTRWKSFDATEEYAVKGMSFDATVKDDKVKWRSLEDGRIIIECNKKGDNVIQSYMKKEVVTSWSESHWMQL